MPSPFSSASDDTEYFVRSNEWPRCFVGTRRSSTCDGSHERANTGSRERVVGDAAASLGRRRRVDNPHCTATLLHPHGLGSGRGRRWWPSTRDDPAGPLAAIHTPV